MPRSKTYTVTKSSQMKVAERAIRKAHAAQRKQNSYLSEDENFSCWKLQLNKLGLELRDIPADGNCLFRALADQLDGSSDRHLRFRMEVCQYMEAHQEDFAPFIDDAILSFDKYLSMLRKPGTFAGNDALVAFSRLYKVTIVIHHLSAPSFSIECEGEDNPSGRELHITYHNGEHYSSVRKVGDKSASPAFIKFKSPASTSHSPDVSNIRKIQLSTGCSNQEFIRQCLTDCDNNVETTIDYINAFGGSDSVSNDSSAGSSTLSTSEKSSIRDSNISLGSVSTSSTSQAAEEDTPTWSKNSQKRLTKADRKKEKKKRAEQRHKENSLNKCDMNHNDDSEIFEVVSQVALLTV